MAKIHQKGDGKETTNGDIPVVAPVNMGKGLKWDGKSQYDIHVTADNLKASTGLHFTKNDALAVKLSAKEGNLAQLLDDGLYIGIKAPADLENLYVDAVNGVDQHPDDVDGAGSKGKPLKTFAYANKIAREGTTRSIFLHTEQEHICSTANYFWLKAGRISVTPYGSAYDDALVEGKGDLNDTHQILVNNNKAPVLAFKDVTMKAGPRLTKEYTYPDLNCFRIVVGTNIQFGGIILRNNLNVSISKHAEATTGAYRMGNLSRVLSDGGGKAFFNRCKFECVGTPQVGQFTDFNQDQFFATIDGTKTAITGFFSPEAGEYNVLNTKMQDNMACMFISHRGWGQAINSSLTVSLATTYEPQKFAKRVYRAKIDTQNGVKILLAPKSDVSATLFS